MAGRGGGVRLDGAGKKEPRCEMRGPAGLGAREDGSAGTPSEDECWGRCTSGGAPWAEGTGARRQVDGGWAVNMREWVPWTVPSRKGKRDLPRYGREVRASGSCGRVQGELRASLSLLFACWLWCWCCLSHRSSDDNGDNDQSKLLLLVVVLLK